ncbi:hypothetical protein BH10CYA1_BH10CYA1_18250 [soil metagenome]
MDTTKFIHLLALVSAAIYAVTFFSKFRTSTLWVLRLHRGIAGTLIIYSIWEILFQHLPLIGFVEFALSSYLLWKTTTLYPKWLYMPQTHLALVRSSKLLARYNEVTARHKKLVNRTLAALDFGLSKDAGLADKLAGIVNPTTRFIFDLETEMGLDQVVNDDPFQRAIDLANHVNSNKRKLTRMIGKAERMLGDAESGVEATLTKP